MCSLTAPGLFDQDPDEGLVVVLAQDLDDSKLPAVRQAVALCPTGALSLVGGPSEDDRTLPGA